MLEVLDSDAARPDIILRHGAAIAVAVNTIA
jgi:hypothetical protein